MNQSLYPKDHYPHGHPDLAKSLNNLGSLLLALGSYGDARGYHERALAMCESLYPKDSYPHGHPNLALSLNNLGSVLQAQGSYGEARGYFERALAMRESLYPKDRYPQGHPDLVLNLHELSHDLLAPGLVHRGGRLAPSRDGHAARPVTGVAYCHLGSRGDELPGQVATESG